MRKIVFSIIFLFFSLSFAISDKAAKLPESGWHITMPEKTAQGDFIAISFESSASLGNAAVTLYTPAGKKAKTVQAFPLDKTKKKFLALFGISIFWEEGMWQLEAKALRQGKPIQKKAELFIAKVNFPKEEIFLNAKNTGIAQNKSPKKKAQTEKLTEVLSAVNKDAPVFLGPFIMPISSRRRTSEFAEARVFKYSNGKQSASYHWGIDFGVPIGTPVNAPGNGRVILAENRITTGWTVVLEHFPGMYTQYYHLSKLHVKQGDIVKQGTLIAATGNTGLSTGPHLHWEARINTTPVSPDALMKKPFYPVGE
ncbi:M23 family metallopeptidase [Treponema phagedenis]|uniref:M23 family metallopeptidase n=1 Tax=Treponema phagedenis TaxID=162 RepID=UPI0011EFA812|nr:M23 family metallopeptidase [Treponema phagedenis]TYT76384.1 M23 family metallopeptidase [Treponema phagedenis]TYT76602.1 M23 family metallopeptidase [Treponema phagedenis]